MNKVILGDDGNVSHFKEFYAKSFLPKATKITQEVYQEPLPRVRKLFNEKVKELNTYSRQGKLELYDSSTVKTRARVVQSIVESNSKIDEQDENAMKLLYKHYMKEDLVKKRNS